MDRLRKAALLTRLIERLRERGSWCGETHVQKAAYFGQVLAGLNMDHEFVLYRHGPFSFDLRADLTGLRADGMTTLEIQYPYGPRIQVMDHAHYIQSFYPRTLKKHKKGIGFIAGKLGGMGVADLERLGTAFFLSRSPNMRNVGDDKIGERVHELKRHISPREAIAALREARKIEAEAKDLFPS